MVPPIDPSGRNIPSRGRCFLYVFPCAYEDILKLGFSRDPLDRLQALHPRYFEFFDVDRGFLVETDSVREARALELSLGRCIELHNAPAPLVVSRAAAGHTEWYRGAYATLATAIESLSTRGHTVHAPLRGWLRQALHARSDLLFTWADTMLDAEALTMAIDATPMHRAVRDALDAHVALDLALEPLLPVGVLEWYRRR
jgi:hypothetical protein